MNFSEEELTHKISQWEKKFFGSSSMEPMVSIDQIVNKIFSDNPSGEVLSFLKSSKESIDHDLGTGKIYSQYETEDCLLQIDQIVCHLTWRCKGNFPNKVILIFSSIGNHQVFVQINSTFWSRSKHQCSCCCPWGQ
jgi:hypothetical protein